MQAVLTSSPAMFWCYLQTTFPGSELMLWVSKDKELTWNSAWLRTSTQTAWWKRGISYTLFLVTSLLKRQVLIHTMVGHFMSASCHVASFGLGCLCLSRMNNTSLIRYKISPPGMQLFNYLPKLCWPVCPIWNNYVYFASSLVLHHY